MHRAISLKGVSARISHLAVMQATYGGIEYAYGQEGEEATRKSCRPYPNRRLQSIVSRQREGSDHNRRAGGVHNRDCSSA